MGGGAASLPTRILPGPMEGLTGGAFCDVFTRRGLVPCWITPFIRISNAVPGRAKVARRLGPFLDTGCPVIAQLMGTDTDRIAASATLCGELGVAGIDLNCGCPSKAVVSSGAGGERLRDPAWIRQTLTAIRQRCPALGLSVKLRTGFTSATELPTILAEVSAAPVDFIILHFRTVAEGYQQVEGGYERLAQARALLPRTVLIGSGDLFTVEDAVRMHAIAKVDGVAPARGLLRNPWLLREIESHCAGSTLEPRDLGEHLGFLTDVTEAAAAQGITRAGFIMEMARHMLGQQTPRFRALTKAGDLQSLTGILRHLQVELKTQDSPDAPETDRL